jgi:hypothetical protein
MTILTDQQATLTQDQWTKLTSLTFGPLRLTVTGQSGEFAAILFRVKRGFATPKEFEGLEAVVKGFTLFGFGDVSAKPPAGVATLDIVYEVRTRGDF